MKKRLLVGLFAMLMLFTVVFFNSVESFAGGWVEEEWNEEDSKGIECEQCGNALEDPTEDCCDCDLGSPHCSQSRDYTCWNTLHCENFDSCGNTIEDSWMCDDCGLCEDCRVTEHCRECGNCGIGVCDDCGDDEDGKFCRECAMRKGYHCISCGECLQNCEVCDKSATEGSDEVMCMSCCEDQGMHCTICHDHIDDDDLWCRCDSGPYDHCIHCTEDYGFRNCEECDRFFCALNGDNIENEFCDNCELCLECCFEQVKHCPICKEEISDRCESDGEHCKDCCDLCEQCESCLIVEEIERCEYCEICLECCRENAEEAGCGCGEYCVAQTGFEDHICEECGRCFGESPKCDYCGLCMECCLVKSEEEGCSDGMCVEDPEFDEHFCEECGACFHSVEACETCREANVNVCESCCENISANLGCDHGICSNVDYWQCHFDSANGVCYCDEDGEDRHDFRDSVTCYVCGAQRDGTPLILVQPKDRIAKANHDVAAAEKVTFSVVAMGTKLTYQWYSGLGTKLTEGDLCYGTKSDTLTVGSSICNADIDEAIAKAEAAGDGRLVNTLVMLKKYNSFYCVVTNAETGKSVTSTTARLSFRHNVIEFRPDNGNSHSANYKVQGGDAVTIKWISSDTHCKVCAGGYYNAPAEEAFVMQAASTCGVHEASEPHVWSRWDYNTEYPAYEGQNGYARRTCLLCKTEEYKAYEYVNPHEHVWSNDAEPITTIVKKTDNQGNVTEVAYEGYHARRCTVEGCPEYTPKEEHLWSAYEITTGATDHSAGERERHCLVCGYVQKETIAPLYHKHDFPVKNPITGWYDLEDMQYVHFSNRMHNVTCRGVVYNEKTGEYEPCGEKANFEQHVLTMDYLDGENDVTCWAEFKFSCPCGFCKKYKSQDYVNYDYDSDRRIGEYRLFSTFPEFQWMFDGMIFYASGQGNPSKIPNGAVVTIYNETGYRFSEYWWNNCIYTIDDSYIQFIDYDDYHVSFRMPTRDVFADIEALDVSQIPECPHEETYYDLSTAMETTCTESGKDPDLKCRQCHVTLEVGETHAALGHNFILDENTVKWPTCTTRGYTGNSICANCGKLQKGVALPADGHETEDHYSWDENKHWPHCVACDKEFLAKAQKHVFDVTTVSGGVTYEMCSICKYFRIKEGESTGADYEQQVFVNDDSEETNLRIRFYPVTVSDEDIVRDMEKETSEIGTEYGYLVSDQYNPHDGRYNRVIEYHVLGAPKESIPRKIAITLGKEYVPYIEERTNYNMVGYIRLKEYTVSFQANGGSGSMDGATVKSGEQYTLPACKFTAPSGFAFDCWKIDGVNYQVGAKVTVLKTTNVTAVWKAVHDETDENLKITKKSLTLYDTIAIEYKIPEAALANYHGLYLMVTQNGVTEKLNDYRTEGGLLIFTYRVAPHMMGEEVTAVPYGLNANNRIVKGEALTYSVAQYCYNMLDKEAYQDAKYATFRRLLVDILRYGDAAQIYMNYKTSELAGKHLTAAQLAMGTDVNVPMTYNSVKNKEFAVVEAGDALASIESVSLYLEAAVNIQFKYVANNLTGLRMVITGDAAGTEVLGEYAANAKQIDDKGRYYASLDNLNAAQMKKTVYATVMKGDKKVSNTYRYSIESYVSAMKGKYSDQLDNLLDSMMRYGNTAADYVAGR